MHPHTQSNTHIHISNDYWDMYSFHCWYSLSTWLVLESPRKHSSECASESITTEFVFEERGSTLNVGSTISLTWIPDWIKGAEGGEKWAPVFTPFCFWTRQPAASCSHCYAHCIIIDCVLSNHEPNQPSLS